MGGIHRLEQCTLVFPMQRAGLFVKQYISQLIAQTQDDVPVVLPHMMTIDSLVDQLCPLQSDDEISSVFQLYEIYQRHTSHTLPLDAFYGWGVQLLNDFSSVDMALLSGEDIMHYTSTIKRYEDLELDKETRTRLENLLRQSGPQHSVQEYFTSLWKALPNIYRDFVSCKPSRVSVHVVLALLGSFVIGTMNKCNSASPIAPTFLWDSITSWPLSGN